MKRAVLVIVMVLLMGLTGCSHGAAYPEKSITFIVPYSPGGGTDTLMRLFASALETELKQRIIVNNVTGGAGQVGMTQLNASKPDGYTIGAVSDMDFYLSILTRENVAYGIDSFRYIASINTSCNVLIVNNSTGIKTLEDFVSYAKDHPGEITVGVSGQLHVLCAGKLCDAADIKLTTIMHDGGGDSLASVLGGQVDAVLIDKMFVEQVKGQDVTVLASFGAERLDVIKDIPTMTELGYKITDSITRLILAPKDTPREIVDRLSEAAQTATDTPGFVEKMAKMSEVYKFLGTVERTEMVQKDFTELKDFLTKNPDILGTK